MNTLHPNIANLILASESLKETQTDFVFVGGSTTILYVDDWTQAEPRATYDVDCVVEVASQGN